ncbi:hypothetical protein [Enterobacter sp. ENT03]|uniref:hypothetical protein n=1 Tax=Enterobacter sp. ENT03 TaxID=2854780 RepID=UPI001C47C450|nr:hypothetical protein [Enterobacter sp. ENT03]MBV7405202.1 hypothetical protein [Enterobacter sp. ENT03]
MTADTYHPGERDLDSVAFSAAFSEWLGIDNLQDCTLSRLTPEERKIYEEKLTHYRLFCQTASGEEFFSHMMFQDIKVK